MNNTEKTNILRELSTLLTSDMVAHAAVCEYSAEDDTPTLHVDLWRGLSLSDLPAPISNLKEINEGFCDTGRCYSLQLND